ncbi:MAG TPA: hypothetical protein VGH34_08430, partial [Vicinamibacterales bacterium]
AGDFARLIWIPAGQRVDNERQKNLIEQLKMDPKIAGRADLLETFFEDLRTMMQDWLKRADPVPVVPPPKTRGTSFSKLYIVADPRDAASLAPWSEGLFAEGVEVAVPIFEGDESEIREYHEENLAQCDGVLIFYGAGNELWLRRKLREVQKAAGYGRTKPQPSIGICLIGPRTPEKERLRTHEATVLPQWDGCAIEPLRPFIAQIKSGGPV